MTASRADVELRPTAIAGAGVTLLLMGSLAAAYGPLLPFFMQRFSIPVPVAGLVFGVHFAGALLGVFASMLMLTRLPARSLLTISLALLGLGALGVAAAPSWPLTLAAVFLIGVGFGQLDLGINQVIAYSVNPARVAVINGLNGVYGIGAVLGPVLVVGAATRYPRLYAAAAVLLMLAMVGVRAISGSVARASEALDVSASPSLIALFALAFGLYVGVEIGVAGWMPTHLHSAGYSLAWAAAITSGFWLALAIGRFLIAPVSLRISDAVIVLGATTAAAIALLLALNSTLAPLAYVLTGLAIAPIFPTGVAWLARLNPANPAATSWLFPASMVGGAVIPTLAGVVIAAIGPGWVPAVFAATAVSSLAAFAVARTQAERPPRLE